MTARVLIHVAAKAQRGEVIEIKTLIAHPMESGFRVGTNGNPIPRDIITLFTCRYNGDEIFRAEFSSAIAANPFLSFSAIAGASGVVSLSWEDDDGVVQTELVPITVT